MWGENVIYLDEKHFNPDGPDNGLDGFNYNWHDLRKKKKNQRVGILKTDVLENNLNYWQNVFSSCT